jgi:poly(3-hydroxybutyrate) depolymerase
VRIRAVLVAGLLVVGAVGLTGCRRSGTGTAVAGTTTHTITVDGQRRTFRVYRPARLPAGTPAPLVVMLHGALGTGAQAESTYGWDAEADRGGFLVAYPDGLHRSWAVSDGCCGPPAAAGVDDVAFITRMVKEVSGWLPVDADRVFATGISNGGMLAYRLACDTTIFARHPRRSRCCTSTARPTPRSPSGAGPVGATTVARAASRPRSTARPYLN